MKFYRVRPEYDQYPRHKFSKRNGRYVNGKFYIGITDDGAYIANELFTEKELKKEFKTHYFFADRKKIFEEVEISKMKTFWSFGVRFEIKEV